MKDDVYERLKRLNKGRLADQLVRARDLDDGKGDAGGPGARTGEDRQQASESEKPPKRSPRKRLTDDMIRSAGSAKAAGVRGKQQTTGLGELGALHRRLKGTSLSQAAHERETGDSPLTPPAAESWEALREQVGAELRETPLGRCLVRNVALSPGEWVGSQQVPEPTVVDTRIIAKLSRDERFASLEPTDLLFLDTETTGLAGGTGTVAFLVGVGYWREGAFQVAQYFMPDYPEETALLHVLEGDLGEFPSLVTYNGKAFDIPLLTTRFIRIRSDMASRLSELPHLDLLHPARRLWKRRLGDCSLTNLESEILGFEREEDVPGWEIPQIYFKFLSDGETASLPIVFLHNQYDLVTLAQLAARACQLYREPLGDPSLSGVDLYSLARSLEMDDSPGAALEVLEEARFASLDSDSRRTVLRHLSRIYKRQKNWEAAVAIWQELGEWEGMLEVFSFEEMAKFYEHVARDLRLAAAVTTRILDAVSGSGCVDPTPYADLDAVGEAFAHRLRRIERKLGRQQDQ